MMFFTPNPGYNNNNKGLLTATASNSNHRQQLGPARSVPAGLRWGASRPKRVALSVLGQSCKYLSITSKN